MASVRNELVLSTAAWSLGLYCILALLGILVPWLGYFVWPGPVLMMLQTWSVPAGVAVLITGGFLCLGAGILVDWARSRPRTRARAILRGVAVMVTTLLIVTFVSWNLAMWMGWQIGV